MTLSLLFQARRATETDLPIGFSEDRFSVSPLFGFAIKACLDPPYVGPRGSSSFFIFSIFSLRVCF